MPTYTVVLKVNVPSVGEKSVTFPNIDAPGLTQAIEVAKAGIIVEPIAVQKTA